MKIKARLRLRRADGAIYLDRWGIKIDPIGAIYLPRMAAPDPGEDLHDHPWTFASLVLRGGYIEERADTRDAPLLAEVASQWSDTVTRGVPGIRGWLSVKVMRLDECHRIKRLLRVPTWTLVVRGPRRRRWGFYLPTGYVNERTYDETVRANRQDLWNENFKEKT